MNPRVPTLAAQSRFTEAVSWGEYAFADLPGLWFACKLADVQVCGRAQPFQCCNNLYLQ
jgi:hypothetical protein